MPRFSKLLIANRGEIALRVMRTAKSMGMQTVAVYSDADSKAVHVKYADDAIHIGPSAAADSYLVAEKIIQAAKISAAEAIHPGYGFLSENAEFARQVRAAGLVFVGPPERAIEIMGDKAVAKRAMLDAGVPCVPGYQGADQSDDALIAAAAKTGFPLMVKAAAGGGGRGMRLVEEPSELPEAIRMARLEAKNAFDSAILIIERAVASPRHVEIQVFADALGNVIHLGERDCSVQRRHQKIIEEAPCPIMTEALRTQMGNAAVNAARAVNYAGAGTVEFLLDENGEFYFLEMNTRLQVEHPVTELITGLDLVAMQLRTAQGEALGLEQSDIKLQGHAMEVRLYAEDPDADFLPCTGPVKQWVAPAGEGIRTDAGIESGVEVSPFYDPMVAKIIACGASREEARTRLLNALNNTVLFGTRTNRDFLITALNRPHFANGSATTAFIGENFPNGYVADSISEENYAVAALLQHITAMQHYHTKAVNVSPELLHWSSTADLQSLRCYDIGGERTLLKVYSQADASCKVVISKREIAISVLSISAGHENESRADLIINERRVAVIFYAESEQDMYLAISGAPVFSVTDISAEAKTSDAEAADGVLKAPMHGVIVEISVAEGDEVEKGQSLIILEAMKMQHAILAPTSGIVRALTTNAGSQVSANDKLLEIGST